MSGPVDVLAVMDAYSVPGQICCGMPVGGGCDENGNGEAPSCCGQPLTERDMQEARAAVAELIKCCEVTVKAFEALGRTDNIVAQLESHRECERALVEQKVALARAQGGAA